MFTSRRNLLLAGSIVLILAVAWKVGKPAPSQVQAESAPEIVALTDPGEAHDFQPDWSPRNDWIVFSRLHKLTWISTDGQTLETVIDLKSSQFGPAFSPDGRKLVFESAHEKNLYDLWLLDLKTFALTRLTDDPERNAWPAWSPDGRKILYTGSEDFERTALFVLDLETGTQSRFSPELSWARGGCWSPDGRWVVFVSSRHEGESRALWIAEADGSHPHELYQSPGREDDPAWSPDGRFIAFVSDQGGTSNIWLLEMATGTARPLTHYASDEDWASRPCFSPNSRWIVFSHRQKDVARLVKVAVPDRLVGAQALSARQP